MAAHWLPQSWLQARRVVEPWSPGGDAARLRTGARAGAGAQLGSESIAYRPAERLLFP